MESLRIGLAWVVVALLAVASLWCAVWVFTNPELFLTWLVIAVLAAVFFVVSAAALGWILINAEEWWVERHRRRRYGP